MAKNGNERKRKTIDLEMKIKIIKQHECGKTVSDLSRGHKLSHSTVSTIIKDKERIREAVKRSVSVKSAIITKKRNGPIHEMEKCLKTWMEDLLQKNVPLSRMVIQNKARSLFEDLKKKEGKNYDQNFNASSGWFERFKKRENFNNMTICGESADSKAAEIFKDNLEAMLVEGNYMEEQIFNVDETVLHYKKMPERTYIQKEAKCIPGLKVIKARVTLLLGGNVSGYKLKPFMIYHSQNPRAFKGINKATLPLHYRSNKKAWMTQSLFEDWFNNCFIPEVKKYCDEKDIPFKLLLILDNAPSHPPHLGESHPNMKVVYLPPNTTSILQPMGQGGIASFKGHYLRTTFAQAIAGTEQDQTLREFWKKYNILHAINNISEGWSKVTKKCMNGIWNKLLKRFNNSMHFKREEEIKEVVNIIVQFAQQLNLEVDNEDVNQLLENDIEELTNQDLIEIEELRVAEENAMNLDEHKEPPKKFLTREMAAAFSQINEAIKKFENMDSNNDRFSEVQRNIHLSLACYNKIYNEKKQKTVQTKVDMFIKKKHHRTR